MHTTMTGRERNNKILLSDEEVSLLKPLMEATGMTRVGAVAYLVRKYAQYEADNFKPN